MMSPLVSTDWLLKNLNSPEVVVLDASMGDGGVPVIPGAIHFDFDRTICDRESPLPHMMPGPDQFEDDVRRLGIKRDDFLVIYDVKGIYSSPRVYWMFKAMGHRQAAVLNGGLPAWIRAGGKVVSKPSTPSRSPSQDDRNFRANPIANTFVGAEQVEKALASPNSVVIDVRSAGRFAGTEPEPRPGLRGGHMPGSRNLPFTELLSDGHYRAPHEIAALLSSVANADQHLIFSCGSGVTACIGALAAELAGFEKISVYDGSWSEWGIPSSRPVETGS